MLSVAKRKLNGWVDLLDARHIAAGRAWYVEARLFCEELSTRYGIGTARVAALIAVLSPGTAWEENKRQVENLLSAAADGQDPESVVLTTYRRQQQKALVILRGADPAEVLGRWADKTLAFWDCISDPTSARVVVDRWIWRALGLEAILGKSKESRHRLYTEVESLFKWAAKDLRPCELQAAVWLCVQGHYSGEVRGALRWSLEENTRALREPLPF
jgi:hypothetical protein